MHLLVAWATGLGIIHNVDAFWRMPCDNFDGLFRMDPIVAPGRLSAHAHNIHGSVGFGLNSNFDDLRASCTSCRVEEDKSAYWTPSLMFRFPNGTVEKVPQIGGLLAYYLLFGKDVQSFPAGFRVIAGDSTRRNFTLPLPDPPKSYWTGDDFAQSALAQRALGFNCLNYRAPAEPSLFRHEMPTKNVINSCANGLRLEIAFPSCWNGKDLDSPDHKAHVAYSSLVLDGNCPQGFPIRVPTLFYEQVFWTPKYRGVAGSYIISNDDTTGNGYHGDYISGWDQAFLQQAINKCRNPSGLINDCPLFTMNYHKIGQCKFRPPEVAARESCAGPRTGLCGVSQNRVVAQNLVPAAAPVGAVPAPIAVPAPPVPPSPAVPATPVRAPPVPDVAVPAPPPSVPALPVPVPAVLAPPVLPAAIAAIAVPPPAPARALVNSPSPRRPDSVSPMNSSNPPVDPARAKSRSKVILHVVVEEDVVLKIVTKYVKRAEATAAPNAAPYAAPFTSPLDHPLIRHIPHLAERYWNDTI